MDLYTRKYSDHLNTQTCLNKKPSLYQRPTSITPEPQSFLKNFFPKSKKLITATEEILYKEHTNFYIKAKSSRSSSPISPNSPIPNQSSSPINTSPEKPNKSRKIAPSLSPIPGKYTLPTINTVKDKNYCVTKRPFIEKTNRKFSKIDSILKACGEESEKMLENSKKIKQFIDKEQILAVKYTQEMEWNTNKLAEINGYKNDLMKRLFEEYKNINTRYENEKNLISKNYNTKNLQYYKEKAKGIKRLLINYKLKVLP